MNIYCSKTVNTALSKSELSTGLLMRLDCNFTIVLKLKKQSTVQTYYIIAKSKNELSTDSLAVNSDHNILR